jgi:cation-transporting ATPase E
MKTIFITLLALISIATNSSFPFETSHLTILELFVIGFASLSLSLQPNEKKVEGDFLTTIFSNAIPGGMILLLNVYVIRAISLFGIFPTENLTMTMQVVAFTLGGVVYLHKVCRPLNVFRAIIFGIVAVAIGFWIVFLLDTTAILHLPDNFFGLTALFPTTVETWDYPLILFALVELNLLIVEPMSNFNKMLMGTFRKSKHK